MRRIEDAIEFVVLVSVPLIAWLIVFCGVFLACAVAGAAEPVPTFTVENKMPAFTVVNRIPSSPKAEPIAAPKVSVRYFRDARGQLWMIEEPVRCAENR